MPCRCRPSPRWANSACSDCACPSNGRSGLDFVSYILAIEEVAAADGGVSNIMSGNSSPCCAALVDLGTEAQKQRFLRPMAMGEKLASSP